MYGLVGGWNANKNQDDLEDDEISDGRNVELLSDGVIRPRGGFTTRGQFLGVTTKILGLHEYIKPSTGARKMIASYDVGDYVLGTTWSATGSIAYTTNKSAWFTNYLDRAYKSSKDNAEAASTGVTYYDGTNWAQVAGFPVAGATASDTPSGLCVHKERLIAWNTTNNPRRVYYSNANAHTIGTLNYFDVDEPVVVCVSYHDILLVFTENYVYRLGTFIFTGVAFEPNSIIALRTHAGCVAARTAVLIGNYVYYLSKYGFYRTDGQNTENLSDKKLSAYWEQTVSDSQKSMACGGVDGTLWRVALSTNASTNNEMITYDTIHNLFYPQQTILPVSCFANYTETGSVGLLAGSDVDGRVFNLNQSGIWDETPDQALNITKDTNSPIDAASGAVLRMAQGFQVSVDSAVNSVQIYLAKNAGTTTDLTVRIETDNSGVPSGTLVTNGSATLTAFTATAFEWKKISFSTAPELTADTTYWLVVQHVTEGAGNSQYYWGSDASSPAYTRGTAATYSSSAWAATAGTDMLFRVSIQGAYDKYFVTKGYPLGTPQYQKVLKRQFIELDTSGDHALNIGVNSDLYSSFVEQSLNLSGNSPIRGSTLTRGNFTRGTQEKIGVFIKLANLRGRRVKFRYRNEHAGEDFAYYGSTVNYRVKSSPR